MSQLVRQLDIPGWIKGKTLRTASLVLALAGMAVYLAVSVHFADTQRSTIDEGLYLYKGYLFAAGTYQPFQDYGPRVEYGPLAYLTQGLIQLWFGPSLAAGRAFAVLTGMATLLGLWLAARRLAGAWWAAAAVWVTALNPALIRFYSIGQSQALVACLLVWSLALALGRRTSTWQACLAAVFSALLLLIRQNMLPVLPLLVAFIFWQHGRRAGWLSLLTGVLVTAAGHLVYWPQVLQMWAPWLPAALTPFLDAWRLPAGLTPALDFKANWSARLFSLLEGLRFHFIPVAGALLALPWLRGRKYWQEDRIRRSSVFLGVLFFSLLGLHLWAGLGYGGVNFNNAFTVNPYLAFFNHAGLLFVISVFANLQFSSSATRQAAACVLILVLSAGVGYGSQLVAGPWLLDLRIPRLLSLLETGQLLPAEVPVWDFLQARFNLPYDASRWLVSTLAGLLGGILILLIGLLIRAISRRLRKLAGVSYGALSTIVFLSAGMVLSPTLLLGGGFNQWDCEASVVKAYRQAGQELGQVLVPGSSVYWQGKNAAAVLLSLPELVYEPQEMDDRWNYYLDGDPDSLRRLGFWNTSLDEQWRGKADMILIQERDLDADWRSILSPDEYLLLLKTQAPLDCSPDSSLMLWWRIR